MTRCMLLLAPVLLCACAVQTATRPPNVNLSGFPPAFKEGYTDGCASAHGSQARDAGRFKADTQYAQGWRDGYDICRRR